MTEVALAEAAVFTSGNEYEVATEFKATESLEEARLERFEAAKGIERPPSPFKASESLEVDPSQSKASSSQFPSLSPEDLEDLEDPWELALPAGDCPLL